VDRHELVDQLCAFRELDLGEEEDCLEAGCFHAGQQCQGGLFAINLQAMLGIGRVQGKKGGITHVKCQLLLALQLCAEMGELGEVLSSMPPSLCSLESATASWSQSWQGSPS